MPDPRKADKMTGLAVNMKALARIHYFYVQGVESATILTEQQSRTHYTFIEEVEKILVGSGYMTESEIKAIHIRKPEVIDHGPIIPFPFN